MTTSSAVWAGVAAAISATLLLASACSGEPTDSSPTSSGPLRLTDGHVGSMLFPLGEPSFITVPACGLSGDLNVEIIAVSAQSVTGTDDVSFQAAWLGPGDELKIGAAGLSKLEDPFEPTSPMASARATLWTRRASQPSAIGRRGNDRRDRRRQTGG